MGSIHIQGVDTTATIGWAVHEVLVEMRGRASKVGLPGGYSAEEFQGYMLYATSSLDALKKMHDIVDSSVRAFHRP